MRWRYWLWSWHYLHRWWAFLLRLLLLALRLLLLLLLFLLIFVFYNLKRISLLLVLKHWIGSFIRAEVFLLNFLLNFTAGLFILLRTCREFFLHLWWGVYLYLTVFGMQWMNTAAAVLVTLWFFYPVEWSFGVGTLGLDVRLVWFVWRKVLFIHYYNN